MLSSELVVVGYIKIPYPYLNEFDLEISRLKGKNDYIDFPDFTMPPIMTIGNAMVMFGHIYKYEKEFEIEVIRRFEKFLNFFMFLTATIQLEIEGGEMFLNEYVNNDKKIHKFVASIENKSKGELIDSVSE